MLKFTSVQSVQDFCKHHEASLPNPAPTNTSLKQFSKTFKAIPIQKLQCNSTQDNVQCTVQQSTALLTVDVEAEKVGRWTCTKWEVWVGASPQPTYGGFEVSPQENFRKCKRNLVHFQVKYAFGRSI